MTRAGEQKARKFSIAVFSSWDHGLYDRTAVKIKKQLIGTKLDVSFHPLVICDESVKFY